MDPKPYQLQKKYSQMYLFKSESVNILTVSDLYNGSGSRKIIGIQRIQINTADCSEKGYIHFAVLGGLFRGQ